MPKTQFLSINRAKAPKFINGTKPQICQQVKYLGVILDAKGAAEPELNARIAQTMATWKHLDKLWKFGKLRVKTRLKYWTAICRSQLTHGLHTMALKTGQLTKLKALQMKGLRKIMHLQHPYINRGNTNQRVLRDTNNILRMETTDLNRRRRAAAKAAGNKVPNIAHKPVVLIATELANKRIKYFGHIVRADPSDPLKLLTFRCRTL